MRRPLLLAAGIAWLTCCSGTPTTGPAPSPVGGSPALGGAGGNAVLVGAGDIALCGDVAAAEATAKLLDATPGTIFTVGDNVQGSGITDEFSNCYVPTWGRHRGRTRPAPGNHDYHTAGAVPYFAYFASNAGSSGFGYYSYELGAWHIISLNSNIAAGPGSPQFQWLVSDLNKSQAPCTVAYWHHPLFSSGPNGPNPAMQDVWRLLYDHGVDVIMNGHDHLYERFEPQDPSGRSDADGGIRQFTVGTGGAPLYSFVRVAANSEVRASVHGILRLDLQPGFYSWEFLPAAGQSFRDSGVGACH